MNKQNSLGFKYFEKSFERLDDSMFLHFNDIDKSSFDINHNRNNDQTSCIWDPRTHEYVRKNFIDTTKKASCLLFRDENKSILTKKQHQCLFKMLTQRAEIDYKTNLYESMDEKTREDIVKEKELYQQIAKIFENNYKRQVYQCTQSLSEIYSKWYAMKMSKLMTTMKYNHFCTYTALPNISANLADNNESAEISKVKIIDYQVKRYIFKNDPINFKQLRHRLETYCYEHDESILTREKIEDILKNWNKKHQMSCIFLPLNALLFLITSGTSVDLPSEVEVHVENSSDLKNKNVIFDEPLPSKNCGRNAYNFLFEKCLSVYQSKCREYNSKSPIANDALEIDAGHEMHKYNVTSYKDFMEKKVSPSMESSSGCIASFNWSLGSHNQQYNHINIITALNIPPTLVYNENTKVACQFVKLEYKPAFGCEIFTQYELLKAWFYLSLVKDSFKVDRVSFLRISAKSLETETEELLSIEKIEFLLNKYYNIKMPQFLNHLGQVMSLLMETRDGDYLFRYDSRHPNNIIISTPESEKVTSFSLKETMQTKPTDLEFMLGNYYLPICDYLCSRRHYFHQSVPGLFLPSARASNKTHTNKLTFFNDRQNILEKIKLKKDKYEEHKQKYQRQLRSRKKRERRKRVKETKKAEMKERQELEKEMEVDRKIWQHNDNS